MTAQGEDVLAWLDAAITRREEAARDAARSYGSRWVRPVDTDVVRISEDGIFFQALSDEIAEHVVYNDPESVLRRCAADRKLLELHEATVAIHGSGSKELAVMNWAIRNLAEGYGWTGGEQQHCGYAKRHPSHTFMRLEVLFQCPGVDGLQTSPDEGDQMT